MANTTCIRCSRPVASLAANALCETCRRLETDRPHPALRPGLTPFRLTRDVNPDLAAPTQRLTEPQFPPPVLPGYEIRETLGGGGMGVVYLAYEKDADRLVALKFARAACDPAARERFRVEIQSMARLDHKNVVRIFAVDLDRPEPYFTMEYVDGPGLDRRVLNTGPLPVTEAVRIMEQVARGIQHAHDDNVIHRDLKPGNIVVGSDGTPKVTDFGLAKRINTEDGLTVYDAVLGTPGFMAPEQTGGQNDAVGKPADIYGLGSTLYALLTGHPPFRGIDPVDVAVRVRTQPPRPPSELRREVSAGLDAVILKCLAKDPAKRFASASELADELARWLQGKPLLTPLPSRVVRLGRAIRRRRSTIMTGFVPFLALFVASSGSPAPPVNEPSKEIRINLLDKTGMPRFASWQLNGFSLLTSEGHCVIDPTRNASLLQISPSPQMNRYRIQMEFKQEAVNIPECAGSGLYFGYDERPNDRGVPVHAFYCVRLSSFRSQHMIDAGIKPEVRFDRMKVFSHPLPQAPTNLGQHTFTIASRNYTPVSNPMTNEPWRYVEVEVTPTSIRVLWREKPGDDLVPLCQFDPTKGGDLVRAYGQMSKPEVLQRNLSLFDSWHPQRPIGFYNCQSRLVIRSAVLESLPE